MFKKPHQLKPSSPLRSSDRRKLIAEIQNSLGYELSPEQIEATLPKNLTTGKFSTHIDEPGVLYVADKDPAFFRIKKYLAPSVYTLWKVPGLLPKIYTNSFVLSKLVGGADLMIPGIYLPPGGLPVLKENDLVSICLIGQDSDKDIPFAVGYMACDSNKIAQEDKGRGICILHTYGDHLWSQGSKSKPSDLLVPEAAPEEEETEGTSAIDTSNPVDISSVSLIETSIDHEEETKLSTEDVDEIFIRALYQSLTTNLQVEVSKPLLPIDINILYSNFILPCRQIDVDIKASSWKKLAKFIKSMEKMGILSAKEIKGVLYVKAFNYDYPGLKDFVPHKIIKQTSSKKETSEPSPKDGVISTIDLYRSISALQPIFYKDASSYLFTRVEVRDRLNTYFIEENLVDPKNSRNIKINPFLCDALLQKHEYFASDFMARDQLLERVLTKMKRFHRVEVPGQEPIIGEGTPEPVKFVIETRQGRKSVTKVYNVELYGFDPDQLAKEFQTLCATSVSVTALPAKKSQSIIPKEIFVQGPQQKLLSNYLTTRGLPSRLIVVDDKTKGKKKK